MLLAIIPAYAVAPDEVMNDAALEARAREISTGLRCLVCQNQSIDDSDAALARDLRRLVRERLIAGDTDAQVRDFLVARFGPYILLRPPWNVATILLWLTPALCLVFGASAIALALRRRRRDAEPLPLDAGEQEALRRLTRDASLPAHRDGVLGSRADI